MVEDRPTELSNETIFKNRKARLVLAVDIPEKEQTNKES